MSERCPMCDRPAGDSENEHWQGNRTVCERFFLLRRGLTNDAAVKECRGRAVDWRLRYLGSQLHVAALQEQLRVAQRALSRHHAAAHAKLEPFRDNARIE